MSADNFFFAAALIGRRTVVFLGVVLSCFGADFPFHFAHRCFIASEMRLRAAVLIRRRFPPVVVAFGGRPRRGAVEVSPSSAEMAWSRRLRSAFKSETSCWMSIESLQILYAPHIVAVRPYSILPAICMLHDSYAISSLS